MKKINYIKHLNIWFSLIIDHPEVKPSHISIYVAIFQQWNLNLFAETFIINRAQIMTMSKIGSKTTYSKCLQDMVRWEWIVYQPSTSMYSQSVITLIYMPELLAKQEKIKKANAAKARPKNGEVSSSTTSPKSGTLIGSSTSPESGTSTGLVVGHIYKTINNKQKHKTINQSQISKYDEFL